MNGESFFDCCLFFLTPFNPNGVLLITSMRHHDYSFMLCRLEDGRFDHYKWGDEVIQTLKSNVIFYKGNLYALRKDWSLAVVDSLFPLNISKREDEEYSKY